MKYIKFLTVFLLAVPFFSAFSNEQGIIEPANWAIDFGKLPDKLTTREKIKYSLLFSGSPQSKLNRYERILISHVDTIQKKLNNYSGIRSQSEFVLNYMHDRILSRYAERATTMDKILSSGTFNCVSSAVLYQILMTPVNVDLRGTTTKTHAFVTLVIDDDIIDVETTSTYGFDPGSKKSFSNDFGNTTGYAYVPPSNYRKRSPITQKELISLILHNRISNATFLNKHTEAVTLAVNQWEAVHSQQALEDYIGSINNYISRLNNKGNHTRAISVLQKASSRVPDDSVFSEAKQKTAYNHTVLHINSRKFETAFKLAESYMAKKIFKKNEYNTLMGMITDSLLSTRLTKTAFSDISGQIQTAFDNKHITPARYREMLGYVYLREAKRISASQGFFEAARFLKGAPSSIAGSYDVKKAFKYYQSSFTADIHNRFAKEYNRGNFEEAYRILKKGLMRDADNKTFLKDLKMVEKKL